MNDENEFPMCMVITLSFRTQKRPKQKSIGVEYYLQIIKAGQEITQLKSYIKTYFIENIFPGKIKIDDENVCSTHVNSCERRRNGLHYQNGVLL